MTIKELPENWFASVFFYMKPLLPTSAYPTSNEHYSTCCTLICLFFSRFEITGTFSIPTSIPARQYIMLFSNSPQFNSLSDSGVTIVCGERKINVFK